MASDSASASSSATATKESMEKKVNDEIMEKETETIDVVKDKSASDPINIVVKEEQVDPTLNDDNKVTSETKKESAVVVEEVADVETSEESAEKRKDENGEKKEDDQMEPRETVLKECVDEEVNVEAVDEVKETVEVVEVKEESSTETLDKEDVKIVGVSESTDVEAVSVKIETTEVKVPEVESKPKASEAKESASEVEVKAEENSETLGEAEVQVKMEETTVETECPEDLVSELKKNTEEVANLSPADLIEKISVKAKDVAEEPSKEEDKDVVTKPLLKEDETIMEAKTQEKVAETSETEPEGKENGEAEVKVDVAKPKHSNNIMSKVKQSLVKAKKAIIGKSPSSKTISTEAAKE